VNFHRDNLRFWLNRGVDGFRFDAVGNLVENGPGAWLNQPENYALMNGVRQLVAGYAQRFMVCEGPDDPIGFAQPTACGSAFAFGHQSNLINAARGNTSAIAAVANYFASAPAGMSTMLSNHDSFAGQRLWDQLGGNAAQYRLAAATYLLQPGTPFIYYGEEIGMAGASANIGDDPKLRTPMSWAGDAKAGFTTGTPFRALSANVASNNVAAQSADPNSLLNFYKAVIAVRRAHPSLTTGTHAGAAASGTTLSFQRVQGNERAVVMINYGITTANITAAGLPGNAALVSAFPASGTDAAADAGGSATVSVPAQSVRVFITGS